MIIINKIIRSIKKFNNSAKKNNLNLIKCWMRFIPSYIILGFVPSDFFSFNLINKNLQEQKKFISNRDRNDLIKKYNTVKINKLEFNKQYKKFIKRNWLVVTENNYNELLSFLNKNGEKYISKPIDENQGKGITLIELNIDTDYRKIYKENINKIVEEYITQDDKMSYWNQDSVNTIRIVTTYIGEDLQVISSAIRVGQKGSFIDNMSQGGGAAGIDYKTGIVRTPLINKNENKIITHEIEGYKIPKWKEIQKKLPEIVKVNDEFKFVGWDFAITKNGIELIEGNSYMGLRTVQGLDYEGKRYLIEDYL